MYIKTICCWKKNWIMKCWYRKYTDRKNKWNTLYGSQFGHIWFCITNSYTSTCIYTSIVIQGFINVTTDDMLIVKSLMILYMLMVVHVLTIYICFTILPLSLIHDIISNVNWKYFTSQNYCGIYWEVR